MGGVHCVLCTGSCIEGPCSGVYNAAVMDAETVAPAA